MTMDETITKEHKKDVIADILALTRELAEDWVDAGLDEGGPMLVIREALHIIEEKQTEVDFEDTYSRHDLQ